MVFTPSQDGLPPKPGPCPAMLLSSVVKELRSKKVALGALLLMQQLSCFTSGPSREGTFAGARGQSVLRNHEVLTVPRKGMAPRKVLAVPGLS